MIIINGKKIPSDALCISAFDRGLTLGDGLFETLLIHHGNVPLLRFHWDRLILGCQYLGITLPFDYTALHKMVQELILENNLASGNYGIRLTVTHGVSERGLLASSTNIPTVILTSFDLPHIPQHTMTATIVSTRRNEQSLSSRVKSLSYLDNILAKREAVTKGFDEALLLNSTGCIAEGATTNVFIIHKNAVYTPPIADGALPGVVRHILLHHLSLEHLHIEERSITPELLFNADEVFITNALRGVVPIRRLDEKDFITWSKTEVVSNAYLCAMDSFSGGHAALCPPYMY